MEQDYESKDEHNVGITEFISTGRQVPALTKYLFSDFIVNQIDKNQQLVALKHRPDLSKIPKSNYEPKFDMNEELEEKIQKNLGEEAAKSIKALYYQLECGERVPSWELILERELTKEERKQVHDFVREELHLIESLAIEGGRIRLKYNKNIRKMDPKGRHKYLHFTMYKHGIDTFNALFRLSKVVGISEKLFSTAGLKDKRGHTTQRVSLYNTDISTILKFYKEAHRNKEIWIDDFLQLQEDKIEVGGLSGNQFGLILRLINPQDADEMVKRVESLKHLGMINYFGLQRFGQFSTKTYEHGILYAKREWRQLVESILLSDCNNDHVNNLKREIFESKKFARAEKALTNKFKIEKMLFRGLARFGENYQNAFENLPRSIKSLYSHSLQSYIWNRIASRRFKQLGLELLPGDMVGRRVEKPAQEQEPEQAEDADIELLPQEEEADEEHLEAILVTEDNKGSFSIADLVLPLFGPQTELREGTWLHKAIHQQLAALDLTEADFKHSAKIQNAKSAWRKTLVIPEVLDFEVIKHQSPKDELQSPFYTFGEKELVTQGELTSLRVVLRLPKSAYATMAIRELSHVPSSFEVQRKMNFHYEQKHGQYQQKQTEK